MRTYTSDWRAEGPGWKDLVLLIVGLAFLVGISLGFKERPSSEDPISLGESSSPALALGSVPLAEHPFGQASRLVEDLSVVAEDLPCGLEEKVILFRSGRETKNLRARAGWVQKRARIPSTFQEGDVPRTA